MTIESNIMQQIRRIPKVHAINPVMELNCLMCEAYK